MAPTKKKSVYPRGFSKYMSDKPACPRLVANAMQSLYTAHYQQKRRLRETQNFKDASKADQEALEMVSDAAVDADFVRRGRHWEQIGAEYKDAAGNYVCLCEQCGQLGHWLHSCSWKVLEGKPVWEVARGQHQKENSKRVLTCGYNRHRGFKFGNAKGCMKCDRK